jgi:hypothetical protein
VLLIVVNDVCEYEGKLNQVNTEEMVTSVAKRSRQRRFFTFAFRRCLCRVTSIFATGCPPCSVMKYLKFMIYSPRPDMGCECLYTGEPHKRVQKRPPDDSGRAGKRGAMHLGWDPMLRKIDREKPPQAVGLRKPANPQETGLVIRNSHSHKIPAQRRAGTGFYGVRHDSVGMQGSPVNTG